MNRLKIEIIILLLANAGTARSVGRLMMLPLSFWMWCGLLKIARVYIKRRTNAMKFVCKSWNLNIPIENLRIRLAGCSSLAVGVLRWCEYTCIIRKSSKIIRILIWKRKKAEIYRVLYLQQYELLCSTPTQQQFLYVGHNIYISTMAYMYRNSPSRTRQQQQPPVRVDRCSCVRRYSMFGEWVKFECAASGIGITNRGHVPMHKNTIKKIKYN